RVISRHRDICMHTSAHAQLMADEKVEMGEVGASLMSSESKPPPARPPNKFEWLFQTCLGELVGTTFFVFIGCVSFIENVESAVRLLPALVHGLAVAVMVVCMMIMVAPHLTCQLVGGVFGAVMVKAMTLRENFDKAHGAAFALLQSDGDIGGAVFGEVTMTCLVTMVLLLGAVNAKIRSPLVPFMVGCTVIINILAGGDVSGTCLNPTRAFGPAIVSNYWVNHWIYWVGPIAGGLIAAALVRLLLGDRKIRLILK
uniref:Aquaporin 8a, tandem duplicate 2 n=1 Tax=Sander lucioperca TaxID=283035 RepID=A0A8C9Z3A1_SANLU